MTSLAHYDTEIKIKSLKENGSFQGYASVFNSCDQQNDIIKPGAFKSCIYNPNEIKLLWQHISEEPIGVIHSLKEDEYGLHIKASLLLDIPRARETYALIRNRAINGLSIGFKANQYYYDNNGIKNITDLKLFEVSVVTFPANSKANITDIKYNYIIKMNNVLNKTMKLYKNIISKY